MILLESCTIKKDEDKLISFYYWKHMAEYAEKYNDVLSKTGTKNIYLHYFDVISSKDKQVYPNYFIRSVDEEFKNYNIVPVVYIVNSVFKSKNLDINSLADKISKLVNKISIKHFNKKINVLQIDCDWTVSTKNGYFDLLRKLNQSFTVQATIRLHQIKFQKKTGVPPIKTGILMLYNVGNMKDNNQNSILENNIVEKYISENTTYPLNLKLALPLFSQTIITNNKGKIKIIRNTNKKELQNDIHFKAKDNMNFTVLKDTLYRGFFLNKGFNLKLEELQSKEVIKSYKTVINSKMNFDEIIFYHLNENLINNNFNRIIKEIISTK